MIDVVVPARDEGALIGACLRSVSAPGVRVVVVADGCSDDTAERAAEAGAEVVETAARGKAAALNTGLSRCRDGAAVVFLDADTVLTPGTTEALARVLDTPRPLLAAPRPLLVRPTGRLGRDFAAVWTRLPGVEGDVIGAGCYAVSAAGRERWSEFPPIVADDAFVRTLFAPDERVVVREGAFLLVLPEGRELVDVVRRWRSGNAALETSPSVDRTGNLRVVARRPGLWPHLPGFAAVLAAGKLRSTTGWARASRLREVGRPAAEYTLVVDPSVTPAADARAQLETLAWRFPAACVYGAGEGTVVRRGKPAGLALAETRLWERAGKPDRVATLCERAAALGARPLITPLATYLGSRAKH
ncbi:glycosyltransferase [Actinokineospora sp. NBRC 105648]|uniref:glycosyltransferase n=1 Tax=Actinokineospora sp. NBRC 105648 TaxID=3032206 RepID=UPI0024A515BE|nr:glycosyltransferase [Actinokineospora sp. NBRC 105648]GLZ41370.1 hypothetical protein Acsp05_49940 [Actinokineospora sp. NBRC 105648]